MIYEFFRNSFLFVFVIALIIVFGIAVARFIDYIGDNTYAMKDTLQTVVYTVMGLHIYMMFIGMPLWHVLFSLSIQYAFNCFFEVYPVVKPEDPKFIYGVLASLVNHFLLIRMFIKNTSNLLNVALCFVLIWATPFCFFFTMSAAEDFMFVDGSRRVTKTYFSRLVTWLWNFGREKAGLDK
ncbi:hypothetical protein PAPHI01_0594 [Pancytospora philotis]|nr:hypothetical protein PAPHI01_0594 [Pancytospora philotis]